MIEIKGTNGHSFINPDEKMQTMFLCQALKLCKAQLSKTKNFLYRNCGPQQVLYAVKNNNFNISFCVQHLFTLTIESFIYQLEARVDNFIFQWIPSHCGLPGTVAANYLVVRAHQFFNYPEELYPDVPDAPRNEAVVSFRLATGHDCLGKH
ncbi:hypothetical protein CDAR_126741 [Caerostris darwini]|uniref:RNase H type-1 domain-containing protein n=1 Tax=Caerostris darwini TaxID=1538125 RepID=A0AAV4RCL7_9ARAC|nr:hypothetical protein CDAR_126741 [Caerostris darwini]